MLCHFATLIRTVCSLENDTRDHLEIEDISRGAQSGRSVPDHAIKRRKEKAIIELESNPCSISDTMALQRTELAWYIDTNVSFATKQAK